MQLKDAKERKHISFTALSRKSGCHHWSLTAWLRMERQPHLSGLVRVAESLGMELWIVPKDGCRWPLEPLRLEPWGKDFQIVLSDFLEDAFAAVPLSFFQVQDYSISGHSTVYKWLEGRSQPMALTLFRVLNLAGYTMEARDSPHQSPAVTASPQGEALRNE